jgi:CubicO group peptidase (beta-lactamase class C family)
MKRILIRLLIIVFAALFFYGAYYINNALPIISGYGAKNLCSCTMLAGRPAEDVIANELGSGLLALGTFSVSYEDSSATATVFGLAKRKAIFRKGLGCTLVNEITEAELRAQPWKIAGTPHVNQDTIPWPTGNKMPEEINLYGYDIDRLNKTINDAFLEPSPEKTVRTRAVVVIHDGNLIAEKYADGFSKDSRLIGWSMTKSLTNAMMGVLVRDGKLSMTDKAMVDAWQKDNRNTITLQNLMQASSGLDWQEVYSGPSDATSMLFKKRDAGLFATQVKLKHTPGDVFYYSSGSTNILSHIIRKTVGDESYHRFPYERIFHKTGMYSMVIEPDPGGTFVGSSFSYATARDWARFGLLYLNDGYWMGERILPEGWVEFTAMPAKGAKRGEYGAQFWLNAGEPGNPSNRTYPDVPEDLFYCSGFESQYVWIIPSRNLVVVKLSLTTVQEMDDNQFLKNIIESLPE